MDSAVLQDIRPTTRPPPLLPPAIPTGRLAVSLEAELKMRLEQARADLSLSTTWNDELEYLLSPALSAYEMVRGLSQSVRMVLGLMSSTHSNRI